MLHEYMEMSEPLDHNASDRSGLVRAARLFSNVVSPPTIFALLGLALALRAAPLLEALAWAAVYGFFASLVPILFVLYLLRTNRIAELHMSNTQERHLPYLSAVLFSLLTFGFVQLADGPELLRCLTLFNVVELTALAIINVFWLISIHATGIMAAMVIVGLVFGWLPSVLFVFPFVIAISVVRLYLKRHTPAQVAAGLGLGILSVLSLTFLGCF